MKLDIANNLKIFLDSISKEEFDAKWNEILELNLKGPSLAEFISSITNNTVGEIKIEHSLEANNETGNYNLAA